MILITRCPYNSKACNYKTCEVECKYYPKESKGMVIKVIRKPVDVSEKVKKILSKYYVQQNGYFEFEAAKDIDAIYRNQGQGEIESIEIEIPSNQVTKYNLLGPEPSTRKVILTFEQMQAIAKILAQESLQEVRNMQKGNTE